MPIQVFSGSLTRPMPQYGAANGRGITRYLFDDRSGKLEIVGETSGIDDTGWLVLDAKGQRLYATCEISGTDQSAVAAFAIDPSTANLSLLGTQPLHGGEACHASLSRDGGFLLIANYNGATPEGWPEDSLSVLPILPDGSAGPVVASVRHRGSGPNPERQTTAHAHCVISSPDGRFAYVADLGLDRILTYRFGQDGSLTEVPESDLSVAPGIGPRHLVFHPGGRLMFLVSELVPRVLTIEVDPATGALSERGSFVIEQLTHRVQPSGIVISLDGQFLYVGLRVCNEVLALAVGADGTLSQTGRWPSGGTTPRDLTLTPSGLHLVVANQDSDTLSVFAVDSHSGALSGPVAQQPVGSPMAVVLGPLPAA